MSEIAIDKNIPVPARRRTSKHNFPFASLAVGDSFFVRQKDGETVPTVQRRVAAASRGFIQKEKQEGKTVKFTMRNAEDGVRIWRTE